MEKLNKLTPKHKHCLTDLIKICIFATVMLAPFFAVAVECLYMIVNKNAPVNYTGTQQDVFYNAVNNITTKPLFNWTTSTGIYATINSMCTGLDFRGSANILSILLTYWSLNTAVYIVFDIVISLFTKLTHWLHE